MRKITKEASKAFFNIKRFKKDNTRVRVSDNGNVSLWLFGYMIAWTFNGRIYFSMRGFPTVTTRERLKGLGIGITQRNGEQHYKGHVINCWDEYATDLCLNNRPSFLE